MKNTQRCDKNQIFRDREITKDSVRCKGGITKKEKNRKQEDKSNRC